MAEDRLHARPARGGPHRDGRTRLSAAWTAVVVGVLLLVLLLVFILMNLHSEPIDFFGVTGRIPVAIGLLLAAVFGALVVLSVGVARTTQLRHRARLHRRDVPAEEAVGTPPEGPVGDQGAPGPSPAPSGPGSGGVAGLS